MMKTRRRAAPTLLILGLALAAPAAAKDKPGRWEKAIARFEQRDRENPPAPGGNLFVGSSSIVGWRSLAKDFPSAHVLNRGFGGSQLSGVLDYYDRVVKVYKPARIFLYEGDNDVAAGKTPKRIATDFVTFCKRVHKDLPKTEVYFLTIKPSPSRWKMWPKMLEANRMIAGLARKKRWIHVLDVASPMLGKDGKPRREIFKGDKLHMNEKGYKLWAEVVRPHVKPDPQKAGQDKKEKDRKEKDRKDTEQDKKGDREQDKGGTDKGGTDKGGTDKGRTDRGKTDKEGAGKRGP